MNLFKSMSSAIFNHVTSYLPWGYADPVNDTAISVEKLEGGHLRVTTTQGSHLKLTPVTVVVIPQSEIETLLRR